MSYSSHHPPSHSHHRPGTRIPSNHSSSPAGSASWHNERWPNDPAAMEQIFSSDMRDRQARGKDPYLSDDQSSSSGVRGMHRGGGGHGGRGAHHASSRHHLKEPFQKIERRDWAETVLDNPEMLLMYAQSSGDTLPATRLRFKRIMCGLEDEDEVEGDMARGGSNSYQQPCHLQQQPRYSSQQKSGTGAGEQ